MNANEMFEKLGYVGFYYKTGNIEFSKTGGYNIIFIRNGKRVSVSIDGFTTMDIYIAIHQQMKEFGWIE